MKQHGDGTRWGTRNELNSWLELMDAQVHNTGRSTRQALFLVQTEHYRVRVGLNYTLYKRVNGTVYYWEDDDTADGFKLNADGYTNKWGEGCRSTEVWKAVEERFALLAE